MVDTNVEFATVLDAVRQIVPRLRENGLEAEDRRWLPDENIQLLDKAGVFRIGTPRRFGGLDFSLAEQAAVLAEIGRGCGSTAWIASVWVSSAWMATLFPVRVQQEIFAGGAARVSGGFTPSGYLTPTEGGYRLDGAWKFNSGCRGAEWNIASAILRQPDGAEVEAIAVVPLSDFAIADDWNTSSVAATGSCTASTENLFVPAHRVMVAETLGVPTEEDLALDAGPVTPGRGYGLFSFIISQGVSVLLGVAQGAYELYLERLPGRGIAYTGWTDQSQHPLTHIQVATAASKIAAARLLLADLYEQLQRRADADEQPTLEERAQVRGHAAYAVQLAKEAVDILYNASGATVIQRNVPLQRFHRDIQGLALHGMILLTTSFEVYGRVLLGLDPETPLL
jgi:alkylation response protein AidB-like acyl-CoA dehydrogenase